MSIISGSLDRNQRPGQSLLVRIFGVTVDELVGLNNGAGKRGPTPNLRQQIERLSRLSEAKQRTVMAVIEGVLSQASR